MRFIHIVQFHLMSGGGVGSVLTDLCEAMAKESADIYIISLFRREGIDFSKEQEWAAEKGIHVLLMQENESDSPLKVLYNLHRTIKRLANGDECCLFLHLKMGVLMGILSTLGMRRIKRVEVYHSGYLGYKFQGRISRPFIDRYISVSKEAKQQLIDWCHVKESKIDVVYNGVDVEQIRKIGQTESKDDGLLTLVSIGRLSYEKGFKTSIQAYADLRESTQLANSSYIMIGMGNQRDECEQISKGHVLFKGVLPRETVYKSIGLSDVMVLPSLWEGNSILMLEVLALGKPMIVSDIPSFREVLGFAPLQNDEAFRLEWFGVVFQKDNINACKTAMCLFYDNQDVFKAVSTRLRALGDTFSTKRQANEYFRIAIESI